MKNNNQKKPLAANYVLLSLIFFSFIISQNHCFGQSNKWVVPDQASAVKNPLAGNTDVIKNAQVLYKTYCAACHGNKGKGDGPAAAGLTKKPADHTSDYVQNQTDGALFWMIGEGRNPMPSYKSAFTEEQRWALVNYIRTLAKTSKK